MHPDQSVIQPNDGCTILLSKIHLNWPLLQTPHLTLLSILSLSGSREPPGRVQPGSIHWTQKDKPESPAQLHVWAARRPERWWRRWPHLLGTPQQVGPQAQALQQGALPAGQVSAPATALSWVGVGAELGLQSPGLEWKFCEKRLQDVVNGQKKCSGLWLHITLVTSRYTWCGRRGFLY